MTKEQRELLEYLKRCNADGSINVIHEATAALIEQQAELIEKFKVREDALVKEVFQQRTHIEEMQPMLGKLKTECEQRAETVQKLIASKGVLVERIEGLKVEVEQQAETIRGQAKEIEELKADADIDVCRLQLPDGTVPTYTAACARAWHKWANDYWQQLTTLKAANDELTGRCKALGEVAHETKAENAELRKDRERLDWCWKHHYLDAVKDWVAMPELDMRQTIDRAVDHDIAAMQSQVKEG